MIAPAMLFAAENPVVSYLERIFTPDPFRGIYQVNTFDLLILIPYFVVLIILAFYGSHRYLLLYKYHRNRANRPAPPAGPLHPLPRVTVQLPVYNERYASLGHPIRYLHRDNRAGYKAGALAEGLRVATGEFIAFFDADFLPPS